MDKKVKYFTFLCLYKIFFAKACQTKVTRAIYHDGGPEIFCRKSTYFFKKKDYSFGVQSIQNMYNGF